MIFCLSLSLAFIFNEWARETQDHTLSKITHTFSSFLILAFSSLFSASSFFKFWPLAFLVPLRGWAATSSSSSLSVRSLFLSLKETTSRWRAWAAAESCGRRTCTRKRRIYQPDEHNERSLLDIILRSNTLRQRTVLVKIICDVPRNWKEHLLHYLSRRPRHEFHSAVLDLQSGPRVEVAWMKMRVQTTALL